jgi:hypothetical protein
VILLEKINELRETSQAHDKKEMKKYESIERALKNLQKIVWVGLGAGMILQLIGLEKLKIMFGG